MADIYLKNEFGGAIIYCELRKQNKTTYGEVKGTNYHASYSAIVELSVKDRICNFCTSKSIRRIEEENSL